MTKTYDTNRRTVEYSDGEKWRRIFCVDDDVYKISNFCMDPQWKEQLSAILELWPLDAFSDFIADGYVTQFIDGPDLHGNLPFTKDGNKLGCILDSYQKLKVIDVFAKAREVGERLGYTLGDITCGNMLLYEDDIYLIDYEVIVPYPLSDTYVALWNGTLKIVFE